MAIAVKNNTTWAVIVEDTEGTYKAPASGADYIQALADGAEMVPAKELLERNVFNGSLGKTTPRTGMRSVSGSLPVEMKAAPTEGAAPEYDPLLRAAIGQRTDRSAVTTKTGNTASVLQIEDADIGDFAVNDIVMVKEAGEYHVSPISAVDTTASAANITLLLPMTGAPADNVVIAAAALYKVAESGHPSLSISKYIEGAVLEQAQGCKVSSMALENFTTGQIASLNFGFEGLTFDRSVTASPYTPSYDNSLPPIILEARVYQNTTQLQINELSLNLENSLGFTTSTCSPNGRTSSRVSERSITGTYNPYKTDDSVAQFDKFDANTEYSMFASAHIPTSTAGEKQQVVAVYLPKCITNEIAESDQDGQLQDSLSFVAGRGSDGATDEIVLAFM